MLTSIIYLGLALNGVNVIVSKVVSGRCFCKQLQMHEYKITKPTLLNNKHLDRTKFR